MLHNIALSPKKLLIALLVYFLWQVMHCIIFLCYFLSSGMVLFFVFNERKKKVLFFGKYIGPFVQKVQMQKEMQTHPCTVYIKYKVGLFYCI